MESKFKNRLITIVVLGTLIIFGICALRADKPEDVAKALSTMLQAALPIIVQKKAIH